MFLDAGEYLLFFLDWQGSIPHSVLISSCLGGFMDTGPKAHRTSILCFQSQLVWGTGFCTTKSKAHRSSMF